MFYFPFQPHFHCNQSHNHIKTGALLFFPIAFDDNVDEGNKYFQIVKVQPQGVA